MTADLEIIRAAIYEGHPQLALIEARGCEVAQEYVKAHEVVGGVREPSEGHPIGCGDEELSGNGDGNGWAYSDGDGYGLGDGTDPNGNGDGYGLECSNGNGSGNGDAGVAGGHGEGKGPYPWYALTRTGY